MQLVLLAIRGNTENLWTAVLYMAGILLVVGLAVAVMAAVRHWSRFGPDGDRAGLTLGQVRQLQASGLLTPEEYDRLRGILLKNGETESSG